MDFIVTCHTPDDGDEDRRIQGLGGNGWWYNVDTIIDLIREGHRFRVDVSGRSVEVTIGQRGLLGRQFLTTARDGFPPNNLLKLPKCLPR